jgi:hypothetical protein
VIQNTVSAAGAYLVLSGVASAASVDLREACYGIDLLTGIPCAEKMIADGGWRREFTLPGKTMDSGTNYEIWRQGNDAMLCAVHWTRGPKETMTCALLNPAPAKN